MFLRKEDNTECLKKHVEGQKLNYFGMWIHVEFVGYHLADVIVSCYSCIIFVFLKVTHTQNLQF